MKVTTSDNITREDGTKYSLIAFDTKHTALLNEGEFTFKVLTPNGRKANDDVAYRAIKAINTYYDQFLN
jgi:hypothetical protein